jgi:heme exporter protein D
MEQNMWLAVLKGIRHFLIALAVLVLTAVIQALSNFHPDPGFQAYVWTAISATVIGLVTALMNWLKNKDSVTTVSKTSSEITTTTVKPL